MLLDSKVFRVIKAKTDKTDKTDKLEPKVLLDFKEHRVLQELQLLFLEVIRVLD